MTRIEHVRPSGFHERLPYDDTAAATARRLVEKLLVRFHSTDQLVYDAILVVHELVINGLVHGAPNDSQQIEVTGRVTDNALQISVRDHGTGKSVAVQPFTADQPSGRGLAMVAALSMSWHVDQSSGTRVTARLARS